jgi:tetratricopeptide (TPR) repeat protein
LPNIQFHPANRRIIDLTRLLPLGARYTDHQDKLDRLMLVYEELQETHLKEVAPYYAEVLMNVDRNDEAIELLQRAIKSHPSGIGLRPRLVEALHKEGRYAEAQRLVQAEFERYQEGIKERTGGALRLADEPLMRLSVGRVFFGKLVVGTDQTKKVTVSNLGTSMLEISRITSPLKPFSFVGGPVGSAWVEPGETLELMVRFKPPKSGSYHSSFDILSNTSGKAIQSVMLKGWGGD